MAQGFKKFLPGVREGVLLKDYTTFHIGGPARYFFIAKDEKDIKGIAKAAKALDLPVFIIGGGSNILFSDKGYSGLVVKIQNSKMEFKNCVSGFKIICGAGLSLAKLVARTREKGISGFEWATGIPGTIGGALRGNAGAFDGNIGQAVKKVRALNIKTFKTKTFVNKDCQFSYRTSFFKKHPCWVILETQFSAQKGNKKEISQKINFNLQYRRRSHPLDFPSAGSVFKNPQASLKIIEKIVKDFPYIREKIKNNKVPAGFLIEKAGLKGKIAGGAKISEKHQNVIVNFNRASAQDVKKLIKLIKKKVKKRFCLNLKEEIVVLPEKVRRRS